MLKLKLPELSLALPSSSSITTMESSDSPSLSPSLSRQMMGLGLQVEASSPFQSASSPVMVPTTPSPVLAPMTAAKGTVLKLGLGLGSGLGLGLVSEVANETDGGVKVMQGDEGGIMIMNESESGSGTGTPYGTHTPSDVKKGDDADDADDADADCTDPFAQCTDPVSLSPRQGVRVAHGAQGVVWIGCPNPMMVRKVFPIKTMQNMFRSEYQSHPEAIRERFNSICTDITPALNKLADANSTLLRSACRPACPPLNWDTCKASCPANPSKSESSKSGCSVCDTKAQARAQKLVIDMERADGDTLRKYITDLDGAWHKMDVAQKTAASKALFFVAVQAMSAVDTLYRSRLYHNDMHAENIILRPLKQATEFPIAGHRITITPRDCPFHVAVIDYGLVSRGAPLDKNYKLTAATGIPPLVDLCHFFTSLTSIPIKNIPAAFFKPVAHVFDPVCEAGFGNGRAALSLKGTDQPSTQQAVHIYLQLIARTLALAIASLPRAKAPNNAGHSHPNPNPNHHHRPRVISTPF